MWLNQTSHSPSRKQSGAATYDASGPYGELSLNELPVGSGRSVPYPSPPVSHPTSPKYVDYQHHNHFRSIRPYDESNLDNSYPWPQQPTPQQQSTYYAAPIGYQYALYSSQHLQPRVDIAQYTMNNNTRRSKQHVRNACANCKKAHLSCDDERPCNRCIQNNKVNTCVNLPHKKRGRPRHRDDRNSDVSGESNSNNNHGHVDSTAVDGRSSQQYAQSDNLRAIRPHQVGNPSSLLTPNNIARAFLDIDLKVQRMNDAFCNSFGIPANDRNWSLERLLGGHTDRQAVQRVRQELRRERDEKHPAYLPPIRTVDSPRAGEIPRVESSDFDRITYGFSVLNETLHLRLADGSMLDLIASFRLARTDVIFITLTLPLTGAERTNGQTISAQLGDADD